MIEVGQDGAIVLAGLAAVIAVAWGANLSVRSAARGPAWALEHLGGARPYLIGGVVAALLSTLVLRPVWAGLAVMYVAATVWFLATMLRRNLHRVKNLDGFVEVPAERRLEIVRRARRFLYVAAVLLAVIALAAGTGSGPIAWVTLAMALVLAGTAWGLRDTGETAS